MTVRDYINQNGLAELWYNVKEGRIAIDDPKYFTANEKTKANNTFKEEDVYITQGWLAEQTKNTSNLLENVGQPLREIGKIRNHLE